MEKIWMQAVLILVIGAIGLPTVAAGNGIVVNKLAVKQIPYHNPDPAAGPLVNLPYFDVQNGLRWNNDLVHTETTGDCDRVPRPVNVNGYPIYPRRTHLAKPRVDERHCLKEIDGRVTSKSVLIGVDSTDGVRWQRPMVFPSGKREFQEYVIGATPDGLVLNILEVLSPETGKTIFPAPVKEIASENRSVPKYRFTGAGQFRPSTKRFYVYDAEVTLFSSTGGLYEIDPVSDDKKLIQSAKSTLWRGHIIIEKMALNEELGVLLLAKRLEQRGPGWVAFSVFDLATQREVFEERFGDNCYCTDPYVVLGKNGDVGFSYRNQNDNNYGLVHYRITRSTDR
ncbi:hypothetical protein [Sulfuriflexus mobilis]|uniref:hypothetical protein n=1 Tax=Sulfuriflexus mobilis TaxID=1811807 RepID=UPI000F81ADFC|nr:hypothetical protein [Sulfuriflexus mobilis]